MPLGIILVMPLGITRPHWIITGSGNSQLPVQCQAIILINSFLMSMEPLGANLSESLLKNTWISCMLWKFENVYLHVYHFVWASTPPNKNARMCKYWIGIETMVGIISILIQNWHILACLQGTCHNHKWNSVVLAGQTSWHVSSCPNMQAAFQNISLNLCCVKSI